MESQTSIIRTFVEKSGGMILSEFCEVESGSKTDSERPQLALALKECKKQNATLLVAKLDRLSRNAAFLLRLRDSQVDFVCVENPNLDRFTCGILALVAEKEREMCSARTKAALQAARNRGVRLGNPHVEQSVRLMVRGAKAAKVNFQAQMRPVIQEIKDTGLSTLQQLADALNRRGISTRTGKKWFPATVRLVMN